MWLAIFRTLPCDDHAQDEWTGDTPAAVAALAGAIEAAAAGVSVRQLGGTRPGSPTTTLQFQLIGAALLSPAFSAGLSSSTGSGVAPVSRVVRVMRPSAAIVMFATYGLAVAAGL